MLEKVIVQISRWLFIVDRKKASHDFGAKNVLIKCQIWLTNSLGNK
jgi:hypothetical protein